MALDGAAQRLVTLGHDVVVHETPDGLMVAPSQVKRRHQMQVIRMRLARLRNSCICLLPPFRSAEERFRGCSGRANHLDRVTHAHLPDADSGA